MKKEIEEVISIEPSTNLIDVIASEYSFNSAIADLIDNCLDGKANDIEIHFEYVDGVYNLHILDNGTGMTKDSLKEAAVIGFKSSDELRAGSALGRYSTGLKSASNFLGKSVVVTSKTKSKDKNILKIDFEELKKEKQWKAYFLALYEKEYLVQDHGTLVSCLNLKNIGSTQEFYTLVDGLKTYLNHVFGKYLIEEKVKITLSTNNSKKIPLKGWNPFFLPGNKSTKLVLERTVPFRGKEIFFNVYILPSFTSLSQDDQIYMSGGGSNYNLNKLQGFYIYRSGRLISEAGWLLPDFDITDKTRYARIEVLIPSSLDKYFQVNLTKTKIEIPHELVSQFKAIGQKARSESNKNYNYKKRPETKPKLNKKEDTIWISVKTNKGTALRLNKDSTLLRSLCKNLSESEFNQLINLIGKSFPLGFANSQNVSPEEYTEAEIIAATRKLYFSLKEEGHTPQEITKKITQMEPFNRYLAVVCDVFDQIESEENNK